MHVVQYSLPEITSGYTIRTQAIVRQQEALGLHPLVLTSPRHPAEDFAELDGVPHYRCRTEGTPRGTWLRDTHRVRSLADRIVELAEQRADIQVLHAHSPVLCGMAGLRAARRLGLPLVYEVRGLWEEAMLRGAPWRRFSPRYLLARRLETAVARRAPAVVAISEGLRREFIARGIAAGRVEVVTNGVDPARFAPASPVPGWRREHGLGPGPLVLYLGALRDYEGADLLLEAFPHIRAQHPDAQLLLVGDGDARDRVAERIRSLGQGALLLASVAHDAVEGFYAAADLVVYPRLSTKATELVAPLKPLEAMAMGRAIVASDVGGLRELLTDGESAELFPAGSAAALAAACNRLLGDEQRRQALGRNARRIAVERFDWRRIVARYGEVYRAAAGP